MRLVGSEIVAVVAGRLGITPSAVSQWPGDGPIPESAENRVLAYLARKHLPDMVGQTPALGLRDEAKV